MAPIFIYLPETACKCFQGVIDTFLLEHTQDCSRVIAYYASRGLHEQGRKTLQRVNGGIPGYDVELEYAVVVNTIEEERRERSDEDNISLTDVRGLLRSYADCFRGVNLKRTLAASLPLVMQQVTGLSFLNTYSSCKSDLNCQSAQPRDLS